MQQSGFYRNAIGAARFVGLALAASYATGEAHAAATSVADDTQADEGNGPAASPAVRTPEPAFGQSDQKPTGAYTFLVPLIDNKAARGDVLVQVSPDGRVVVDTATLRDELAPLLNGAGVARLAEATSGTPFVAPAELESIGIFVRFDQSRLELVVDRIDPLLRPVGTIGGRSEGEERLLPSMPAAGFSAYLNLTGNIDWRERSGLATPEIYAFGAARLRNVVLEFDGSLQKGERGSLDFSRRAVRAVYDEPTSFRRWSAGDLRLQSGSLARTPLMAGASVQKSRRVFDPFQPAFTFGGRQILIDSPSTVDVIVNKSTYQTLQLAPGVYNLSDLPVQIGSNDIEVRIRDAAGRERLERYDLFHDRLDLVSGEEEYLAAAGVLAREFRFEPKYTNDWVVLGNYRRGLSDNLTLGGGFQASRAVQIVMAESQIVPQFVPGSFRFEAAASKARRTGLSVRGGYRLTIRSGTRAHQFSLSGEYRSASFAEVDQVNDFRLERLNVNASVSFAIDERTNLVGGATYGRAGGRSQRLLFADVNRRFRSGMRVTAGVEYSRDLVGRNEFAVRGGVSFLLGPQTRADASYTTRDNEARMSVSRSVGTAAGSWGYNANLRSSDGSTGLDGSFDYLANRFDARLSLATSGRSLGRISANKSARLQVGTGIAFADGIFGIGRPIQDAFLLARPHRDLPASVIVGRDLSQSDYEAASGALGAALLGRLSSYNPQDVQYDARARAGAASPDVGEGVVRIHPAYRSGYGLVVGSGRFVNAVGTVLVGDGPARLAVGRISAIDDKGFEEQPFFTNSAGRFAVAGLAPGRRYLVRLNSGATFTIAVPDSRDGLYRMEPVRLPPNPPE